MKKVFLSSTCYDLPDARAQLERALNEKGYDVLLSDRSTFPVNSAMHRHDVCVENARGADGMVVFIDRRFGASYDKDQTISITWAEIRAALEAEVPMVVFVRESIWNERLSFNKNGADPTKFKAAFVDDCRTFLLLSEIQAHPRGIWMQPVAHATQAVELLQRWRLDRGDDFTDAGAKNQPRTVGDLSQSARAVVDPTGRLDLETALTSSLLQERIHAAFPVDGTASVDWEQIALTEPGPPCLWFFQPMRPLGDGEQWLARPTATAFGAGVRAELDVALHLAGSIGR